MRILAVEDQERLLSFIRKGLEEQGMAVDACTDGDEAYALASSTPYDLVILDIMLPERDGLSVLKQLRTEGNSVPVILLTARSLYRRTRRPDSHHCPSLHRPNFQRTPRGRSSNELSISGSETR